MRWRSGGFHVRLARLGFLALVAGVPLLAACPGNGNGGGGGGY